MSKKKSKQDDAEKESDNYQPIERDTLDLREYEFNF